MAGAHTPPVPPATAEKYVQAVEDNSTERNEQTKHINNKKSKNTYEETFNVSNGSDNVFAIIVHMWRKT